MKSNVYGDFYDAVILQIVKPVTVDVSAADYTAQKLNKNSAAIDAAAEQKPFIICETQAVTLKVETWKGDTVTWKFTAGLYPMPLRRIYTDAANVVTETGAAITSIQIGY